MTQVLFLGETGYLISLGKGRRFGSEWKGILSARRTSYRGYFLRQRTTCIATVEQKCLVPSDNGHLFDPAREFSSSTDSSVHQTSYDDSSEVEQRERLRRMRISKANKGNVPWNKGRKHSAETLQRIRERTKLAMQDPKVKMKLANLGHAQSEETRMKIGVGVREGWQRRRKRLMVQESCVLEWKCMVAEAARKGYAGEDEMQWDSYTILDKKLEEEWLQSVEKRKSMPRPKGSKRAPKSPEQRRKISEAISAKWSDPEYRDRVVSALVKYHGTPNEADRRPRKKPNGERPSVKKEPMPLQRAEPKIKIDPIHLKKMTSTKKSNSAPSYKDPMASSKLEMIKKIRKQRTAMEARKREATERAKLLIAEAEKAAKALEVAALKSPLAQASLLETRKLIAEASRSLAKLENGQLGHQCCQEEKDNPVTPFSSVNHAVQMSIEKDGNSKDLIVNGHPVSPNWAKQEAANFGKLALKDGQNGKELNADEENSEVADGYTPGVAQLGQERGIESHISLSVSHSSDVPEREVKRPPKMEMGDFSSTSAPKTTKKWVRGRFVEVEE